MGSRRVKSKLALSLAGRGKGGENHVRSTISIWDYRKSPCAEVGGSRSNRCGKSHIILVSGPAW